MLSLGIIGTSYIAHEFLKAAYLTGEYRFKSLYSRTATAAQEFVKNYDFQVACFTDLTQFLASEIDIVYIATPNSLHFSQAKACLQAKKHTIIEKPAVTKPEEWEELCQLAEKQQVYLFEAARNYHENAFHIVQNFLADKQILGAHFNYAKYSSKMPDLLAGKNPNIFSAQFSGGALMDLGIYTIYAAVRLFGKPLQAHYIAQQLPNSVDLNGSGSLIYPDFHVHILAGKNINTFLNNEIYTTQGTLVLNSIEFIQSAIFTDLQGNQTALSVTPAAHSMFEEAQAFASLINNDDQNKYNAWSVAAQSVHQILFEMRQKAKIVFEVDKH